MASAPDYADAATVAALYRDAEVRILDRVKVNIAKGIDTPTWELETLGRAQRLRAESLAELRKASTYAAKQVSATITAAYGSGLGDIAGQIKDAGKALPAIMVGTIQQRAAVSALAHELNTAIGATADTVLRQVDDKFRQVVAQAVGVTLGRGESRRAAVQTALDEMFGHGLTFTDAANRTWSLPAYAEMAVRTGTAQAMIRGHEAALDAAGLDLCIVQPGPRPCEVCDEYAGMVLARDGEAGTMILPSAVSGQDVEVEVEATLEEARDNGFQHPNCRCSIGAYIPGVTEKPERDEWDAEGYQAQQQQRGIERSIRGAKIEQALALDPSAGMAAAARVSALQGRMRDHLAAHPVLKRQSAREQVTGFPGLPGKGPATPSAPPLAPVAPSTVQKAAAQASAAQAKALADAEAKYAAEVAAQKAMQEAAEKAAAEAAAKAAALAAKKAAEKAAAEAAAAAKAAAEKAAQEAAELAAAQAAQAVLDKKAATSAKISAGLKAAAAKKKAEKAAAAGGGVGDPMLDPAFADVAMKIALDKNLTNAESKAKIEALKLGWITKDVPVAKKGDIATSDSSVVAGYGNGQASQINSYLRQKAAGKAPASSFAAEVDAIKATMAPLAEDVRLIRRSNHDMVKKWMGASTDYEQLIGKTINDDGFLSTNLADAPSGHLNSLGYVQLNIVARAGTQAVWSNDKNRQVILDTDTRMKVVGVHKEGDVTVIDVVTVKDEVSKPLNIIPPVAPPPPPPKVNAAPGLTAQQAQQAQADYTEFTERSNAARAQYPRATIDMLPRVSYAPPAGARFNEPTRKAARDKYVGSGYHEVNGALRGTGGYVLSPTVKKHVAALEEQLYENLTKQEVTVQRSTGLNAFFSMLPNVPSGFVGGLDVDLSVLVGKTFTEPGFTSTSYVSGGRYESAFHGGSNTAELEILVPKGKAGATVHNGGEREFVLAPNTSYDIVDAVRDASGKWHLRLVVTTQKRTGL